LGHKFGGSSPKNLEAQKHIKFGANFRQLRNLIANIFGKKQDIVKRKTASQIALSQAHALNVVNFGPLWSTNNEK